jgi:hypothetical protein
VIGGKVLDASALAALARRRVSALGWFDIAPTLGLTLYLALAEVRAVRPDAAPLLADLLTHPSVVVGELDATAARQVDQLLIDADVFDACAGHCVLTADPGRLRRADPDVQLDLL